jgi:NAD(P)H-dependent FMN reductase
LDIEPAPPTVEMLRTQINQVDVILICTPEYTFSIPGSLKNALDWLVSSGSLYEKRIAIVATSTSGGAKVLASLGDVMSAHQARVIAQASLHPAQVKTDLGGPDPAGSDCGVALATMLRAIAVAATV